MGATAGWTIRRRLAAVAAAFFYLSLAIWAPGAGSATLSDAHHQTLILSQFVDGDDDEHDSDFDFAPPRARSSIFMSDGRAVYATPADLNLRDGTPETARARDPPIVNV